MWTEVFCASGNDLETWKVRPCLPNPIEPLVQFLWKNQLTEAVTLLYPQVERKPPIRPDWVAWYSLVNVYAHMSQKASMVCISRKAGLHWSSSLEYQHRTSPSAQCGAKELNLLLLVFPLKELQVIREEPRLLNDLRASRKIYSCIQLMSKVAKASPGSGVVTWFPPLSGRSGSHLESTASTTPLEKNLSLLSLASFYLHWKRGCLVVIRVCTPNQGQGLSPLCPWHLNTGFESQILWFIFSLIIFLFLDSLHISNTYYGAYLSQLGLL